MTKVPRSKRMRMTDRSAIRAPGMIAAMIVRKPPAPIDLPPGVRVVFLAGSIEMGAATDWQDALSRAPADPHVVILNPRRDAWDTTWRQSIDNAVCRAQVVWELDGLERADVVRARDP